MTQLLKGAMFGAVAGAAGTTALNAATYLDMALRGRPSSSTPEETVTTASRKANVPIPGDSEKQENRVAGLGPLLGVAAGIGTGVALGLGRAGGWRPGFAADVATATAVATLSGNGPMIALGVTNPKEWSRAAFASDLVPHLAYGAVAAGVLAAMDRD